MKSMWFSLYYFDLLGTGVSKSSLKSNLAHQLFL